MWLTGTEKRRKFKLYSPTDALQRESSQLREHAAGIVRLQRRPPFTLIWLDTVSRKHLGSSARLQGGRRAEGHANDARGDPGGSVTNTGQWGKVQPLAPTDNKPPHWLDRLSVTVAPRSTAADVSTQGGPWTARAAFKELPEVRIFQRTRRFRFVG